ncbi:MAG: DUF5610 domain-containing protein [Azoarcus sp.]|jgi:hypothetical protein|nr:DUF5610 domain-containing protein [Azoarcus sp.]
MSIASVISNFSAPAVKPVSSKTDGNAASKQEAVQQSADGKNVNNAQSPTTAAGISRAVRQTVNMQILQASASVSLKAGNQSQTLLFRSAIDRINEVLSPDLGPNAIQGLAASGVDTSPEATANRILSVSTAFFEGYAAQHPGKDRDQLAKDFVSLIRGGFEKGFNDAKDILSGLGALGNSNIASGIQRTYDLVQKGYDDFLTSKLTPETKPAE